MKENEESNGCLIPIILLVLGSIIFTFATTSKEEIAQSGAIVIFYAVLGIGGYFVYKMLSNNRTESVNNAASTSIEIKKDKKKNGNGCGCIMAIAAAIAVVFVAGAAIRNEDANFAVGAIIIIAFACGFGYWLYSTSNE